MDDKTANKVIELTSQFYARTASSFSATRDSAWPGWQRVLEIAQKRCTPPLSVLDVACGNLRFERFLAASGADVRDVCALDNCEPLVRLGETGAGSLPFPVHFENVDLLQTLALGKNVSRETFSEFLNNRAHPCNLAVCFGFIHHIPKHEWRASFLTNLIDIAQPSGIVAISFWQFAKSERILHKARAATDRGTKLHNIDLEDENNYLLGWQDDQNVFRYCHNYTEEEINALVAAIPNACEISRFSADGAEKNLNRYVILEKR